MKDLLNKVSGKVAETKDAAMEAFEANINFAKFSERFTGMTDGAKEKSIAFMNDLISLSPVIEEIGFRTAEITISIGLPPDVTFNFEKVQDVAPEKRDAILKQHEEKPMLNTIVKTLLLAESYQQKLKLGSFRFSNIEICIGLTGGVSFQLIPKEQ